MKTKTKRITTEEFDRLADEGRESVLPYLDPASRVVSAGTTPQRVNVDFPAWVVGRLDRESGRLGITRQSLIKVWIAERLEKGSASS